MRDLEEKAKARWNAQADVYNQWSALGQDEKNELIEKENAPNYESLPGKRLLDHDKQTPY